VKNAQNKEITNLSSKLFDVNIFFVYKNCTKMIEFIA